VKRPLRILYLLNDSGGGATQGIVELLRGLPRSDYAAYLVTPKPPNERQAALFASLSEATRCVPMVWWNRKIGLPAPARLKQWGGHTLKSAAHLRPLSALVRLIREWEIDLVYTTTAMTIEGAIAARLCRVPHLWHIKEEIGSRGRVRFSMSDRQLTRFMTGMSRRVLVMTHFIGEIFVQQGLQAAIEIVHDGVDLRQFEGDLLGSTYRCQLGVGQDEVLVGMAAGLNATWKQHDLFIAMATHLEIRYPQVRFAVFGPEPPRHPNPTYNRPWNYYQELKRQAEPLQMRGRFLWAGFHSDIPQLMDALDILVHPCAAEPFGRVAIEAMAAGTPVVGPNCGGIAESVVDGETGLLVPPHDARALADATGRLICDASLRIQQGGRGRCHVQENFSLEQHVTQMRRMFTQACE